MHSSTKQSVFIEKPNNCVRTLKKKRNVIKVQGPFVQTHHSIIIYQFIFNYRCMVGMMHLNCFQCLINITGKS